MFKKIVSLITAATAVAAMTKCNRKYLRVATISEVNNDLITCVDKSGNIWEFYGTDYSVNDTTFLVMDNNGTENINDDIIVNVY